MKTTKTSEAIAARMRKRGYDVQRITWEENEFEVLVEKSEMELEEYRYAYLESVAKTLTAAYKDIERQWKEKNQ